MVLVAIEAAQDVLVGVVSHPFQQIQQLLMVFLRQLTNFLHLFPALALPQRLRFLRFPQQAVLLVTLLIMLQSPQQPLAELLRNVVQLQDLWLLH
jgi:hypothetical protein